MVGKVRKKEIVTTRPKEEIMRRLTSLIAVFLVVGFAGIATAADTYTFDVSHSSIGFAVKHLALSKVKGTFNDFSGTILYDASDYVKSSVNVVIKTASIDTDNEGRDNHLRSADFFDAEKYPEITFVSERIEKKDDRFLAHGTLTMHGIAKKITLSFEISGPIKGMSGEQRIAVETETKLNRQDYGIKWSKTLDAGGLVVGNEVKIEIAIEAVKQ
jgi:polyisoprenoid-binding protein YceI